MNIQILSDYVSTKQEIKELEKKIAVLEVQITNLSSTTVKDKVSGGEGGIQHFEIEGIPLPELHYKKTLLIVRQNNLKDLKNKLFNETYEVEKFVSEIKSSKIRRIIILRFLEDKSWQETADIIGGDATEYSVKKTFYRFLEKNE